MSFFNSIISAFNGGENLDTGWDNTSILGDASMSPIDRARRVQLKHNVLLKKLQDNAWLQSDERLKEIRDEVVILNRDYVHNELKILNVDYPMNLDRGNETHLIVLGTRADLTDTENRITLILKTRSDKRFWDKFEKDLSVGAAVAEAAKAAVDAAPKLGSLFGGVGIFVIAGIVVFFLVTRK